MGWMDEIKAGRESLAACLCEAEQGGGCRRAKRAACMEQYRARMKANDQHYEWVKEVLLGE